MTIIPTSQNPESFFLNFSLKVTHEKVKPFAPSILGKERFIGTHSNNKLSVMKVRPSLLRPLQRHFIGVVTYNNQKMIIQGRFCFHPIAILLFICYAIFIILSIIPMLSGTSSDWIILAFVLAFNLILWYILLASTRRCEKDVILLLKSL